MAAIIFASVMTSWLGSYTYSPILGFADGRNSVLSGFRISRAGRADLVVSPSDTISLGRGTYTSITALVTPESANCLWMSANGGSWETPDSCEPVYVPPETSFFDVIKVRVAPGCQLPQAVGQIKISVMP